MGTSPNDRKILEWDEKPLNKQSGKRFSNGLISEKWFLWFKSTIMTYDETIEDFQKLSWHLLGTQYSVIDALSI